MHALAYNCGGWWKSPSTRTFGNKSLGTRCKLFRGQTQSLHAIYMMELCLSDFYHGNLARGGAVGFKGQKKSEGHVHSDNLD